MLPPTFAAISRLRDCVMGCGIVLALLLAAGCGQQYVTRGADLYARGDYVQAAEFFEHTQGRLEQASPEERARYGLYRGATFLALGDTTHARSWLRYTLRVVTKAPDALSEDDHVMLERALLVGADPTNEPTGSRLTSNATAARAGN